MDNQSMQYATQEAVKKKFGRKKYLESRVVPRYPENLEREYIRVMNAYMKLLNNAVAEYIPQIRDTLKGSGLATDAAEDSSGNDKSPPVVEAVATSIDRIFDDIMRDFTTKQGLFGLPAQIEKMSNLNRKLTIAEWKRVVKRTLGIDIMEDYYHGVKFQQLFDKWVVDNISLIKTIPQETLGKMREIVKNGYTSGASNRTIAKQIQEAYDVSKSHARFIARDQMAKLNAQVTQEQQTDAGVTEYVWRTVGDARVREGHKHLNNRRFKYADPPVVDLKSGRRANPGEDYNCRCVALPVFDIGTIVLPWEAAAKAEKGGDLIGVRQ